MNPNHWPVNDWVAMTGMYEQLLRNDGAFKPTVNWLLESWKYLSPTSAVIKFKKGVLFHDGTELNAESYQYQIDWIKTPVNGAWTRALLEPIKSIELIDRYTLRFEFRRPWAAFAGVLAYVPGFVISKKALEGDIALRELNRSKQKVSTVKKKINKLGSKLKKQSGAKAAKTRKKIANERKKLAGVENQSRGPTKDIRVRKAISHAIDRKALIAGTLFDLAVEASSMYPMVHWGHNPNLEPVRYDPAHAKRLLAEAGYADGLTLKGDIYNTTEYMTIFSAVKNMLSKVGVTWQYDVLDAVGMDDRMKNLEFNLRHGGWSWILDPDQMASGLYHPDGNWNQGRVNLPKVTALIEQGRTELDPEKRQQIYWQIEEELYKDYIDIWLFWPKDIIVLRKPVMGFNLDRYLAGREAYWHAHDFWFKDGRR